jgi:hypothetical protein
MVVTSKSGHSLNTIANCYCRVTNYGSTVCFYVLNEVRGEDREQKNDEWHERYERHE